MQGGNLMGELSNCPECGRLFVKGMHEICEQCRKEEDKQFDIVYNFIRQKENRSSTIADVIEGTQVDEDLIYKFIRQGRLQLSKFPNLGYPCQKCGKQIREGKLCKSCATELKTNLEQFEKETERQKELDKKEKAQTYFSVDKRLND